MKSGSRAASVVEFENSTWVVARGVRHTEWFVQAGAGWKRVAEIPEALATAAEDDRNDGSTELDGFLARPPGCQYLCRFRLLLPFGTAVERRISMPRDSRALNRRGSAGAVGIDLRRDILSHFRYAKPPLAVVETRFRVARSGLVSEARWAEAMARKAASR